MLKNKIFGRGKIIFISVLFFLLIFPGKSLGQEDPRFLIIHLDAVSFEDFQRELERGSVPNLERIFADEGAIFKGLSPFPGGTEVIVPRMKTGERIDGEGPSGWGYYDYDQERMVTKPEVALEYMSFVLRRSRGNFTNVLPLIDHTAFFSIINIPSLLERYQVAKFFWFSTDYYGHYFGPEQHLNSLKRFDRMFGYLVDRLDLDKTNLILYVDHGMTFGEMKTVDYSNTVEKVVGENLLGERYPNIYLKDQEEKEGLAWEIAQKRGIEFAFFREGPNRVKGFHKEGEIIFEEKGSKIRYTYSGKDVLEYYDLDYAGEFLDDDEWLHLTSSSLMPAAPVNIYRYFDNPRTGEIITVMNPPYIFANPLVFFLPEKLVDPLVMDKGAHAGLHHSDLLVPVMVRGPEVEHLYDKEVIWLYDLLANIPELDFDNYEPAREQHSLNLWTEYNDPLGEISFSASYSPEYRFNLTVQKQGEDFRGWLERDIFSTHSIRTWLGAGLDFSGKGDGSPLLMPRLEFKAGALGLELAYPVSFAGEGMETVLSLEFGTGLRLDWHVPAGFGLGYRF